MNYYRQASPWAILHYEHATESVKRDNIVKLTAVWGTELVASRTELSPIFLPAANLSTNSHVAFRSNKKSLLPPRVRMFYVLYPAVCFKLLYEVKFFSAKERFFVCYFDWFAV